MIDRVELATRGAEPADKCPRCRRPLCFRVSARNIKRTLNTVCGNSQCELFLCELFGAEGEP